MSDVKRKSKALKVNTEGEAMMFIFLPAIMLALPLYVAAIAIMGTAEHGVWFLGAVAVSLFVLWLAAKRTSKLLKAYGDKGYWQVIIDHYQKVNGEE